jgi:hypothetical protein
MQAQLANSLRVRRSGGGLPQSLGIQISAMTNAQHIPPAIRCPNDCGSVLRLEAYFPGPFFERQQTKCPSCGKNFDLWDYAVKLLRKKAQLFRNKGAAFIGGREVYFTFQLPPNQTAEVDLSQYGVPEDSKLIYVVYTPMSGAGWPIEMHSNQPLQHRTTHKMMFFGKPFPDAGVRATNRHDVDMSVTYIPKSPEQIPFGHLADAYEHFLADSYEEMIIPSAVALEYAIERVTVEVLKDVQVSDDLNPSKRLSLEVIVPLICRLYGVQSLDGRIVELVVKLWRLRNLMAHEGALNSPLDQGGAAQLLAAAMFCLNYLVFFRNAISEKVR